MELRFDPEKHIYTLGDRRLPSVTEIVNSVCGVEHYADEWYLHRGSMIHRCIALYLAEKLDEKTVDERIRGRLEMAKKAIKELQIEPYLIERPLFHKVLQFAGTPDLYTSDKILIDFKSSYQKNTAIQMGGYVKLLEANKYIVKECYEIVLEDDRYIIGEHKSSRYKGLFLACLSIYNWRNNGK